MFNKTSTAVYMLIALVVLVLAYYMSKPVILDTDGVTVKGYIKPFNFGVKKA